MTAQEIIKQWNNMTGESQFKLCENCVKRAIKQGRKLKAGYEFDDAVQSTAERVLKVLKNPAKLDADTERRESQGKAGNTLEAVVCRAANNALQGIAYHSDKDSKVTSRTITSEDGDEIDILDTIAAAEDTEASAIFRATLQQFVESLDKTNQKILAGRIDGLTEREISQIVCISNVAVHNRLAKMQKALAAMLN